MSQPTRNTQNKLVNKVGAVWLAVAVWVYAFVVAPAIYHISLTYKGV